MTNLLIDLCDYQTHLPRCGNCGSGDTPTGVLRISGGDNKHFAEACSDCLADWLAAVKKVEEVHSLESEATDSELQTTDFPPCCPDPHAAERSRMAEESHRIMTDIIRGIGFHGRGY